ncbi:hypothetical protein N8I77_008716 [Diaporthe amygdali]|uniref:Uncharacterized protein n=1 Tax=Phomopsis amygdali TaxID=1214568 RepID=A0AAD9S8P2_PHOAM|nr:hypothetical protein N8I77_008716 [Diaporthe amygdali]
MNGDRFQGPLGRPHLHIEFPGDVSSKSLPLPAGRPCSCSCSVDCGGARLISGASLCTLHFATRPWEHDRFSRPHGSALYIRVPSQGFPHHCPNFLLNPSERLCHIHFFRRSQDELKSTVTGQPTGSAFIPGHGVQGPHPETIRLVRAAAAFTPFPVLQGLHQTRREGSTHGHVHLPAGLLGLGQAGAG